MSWIVPRTWVVGEIIAASKLNEISNDLSFLYTRPQANSSIIPGTAPPAGVNIYPQVGSQTVTTDSGALFQTPFPSAFGSGLITVVFTPGDVVSTPFTGSAFQIVASPGHSSLAQAGGYAWNMSGTGPLASMTIRVNFVAWGW